MTAIGRDIVSASSWSWVTYTNVIPTSRWMCFSSSCICLRSCRSSAPSGSSSSRTAGRLTSARASATRCRWPPESCRGFALARSEAHELEHLPHAAVDLGLARDRAAARVAPGQDDFLLLTEPELGPTVLAHLRRMRIAAKCEIKPKEHASAIVLGGSEGIPNDDYGVAAVEVLDGATPAEPSDEELERLRILARTPRWGTEIDDGILPAEAGLADRAVSFSKGCYPGQEPLARLRRPRPRQPQPARARARRRAGPPRRRGSGGRPRRRGRPSSVPGLALGYVRVEVPDGAAVEGRRPLSARSLSAVTLFHLRPEPHVQGSLRPRLRVFGGVELDDLRRRAVLGEQSGIVRIARSTWWKKPCSPRTGSSGPGRRRGCR